jgi:hypothetical protein
LPESSNHETEKLPLDKNSELSEALDQPENSKFYDEFKVLALPKTPN